MIGLAKSNLSLADTVDYNIKHKSSLIYSNMLQGENITDFRLQMEDLQKCYRGKANSLTIHAQISPTIEDGKKMMMEDWKKLADLYLEKMELENHQALFYLHKDRGHFHLHAVINRVNEFTFKLYNDSFIGKKTSKAAHEIALALGLTSAREMMEENKKREKDVCLDTAQPTLEKPLGSKQAFKAFLQETFKRPHKDLNAFFNAIEDGGYKVLIFKEKDKQAIRGYAIGKNGTFLNASEIDRKLSLKNLVLGEQTESVAMEKIIAVENKKETPILALPEIKPIEKRKGIKL